MESRASITKKNFGLSSTSEHDFTPTGDAKFDSWFWESKAKKRIKEQEKQAQIERMRAETAAMQQILSEPDNTASNSMNIGKIALIGGIVILIGIGAVALLKKKQATETVKNGLSAEDLMV